MSTGRRSSRLSQASASQVDDSRMDVDNSEDEEAVQSILSPNKRQKRTATSTPSPIRKRSSMSSSSTSAGPGSDLFEPLKNGAVISTLIEEWMQEYGTTKGKHKALQSLVSLMLDSSLLSTHLTANLAATGDEKAVKKFVESIKVDMNADLPEFPLTGRTPPCTRFAKAYTRFWHDLVEAGSESALVDDFLLPRLMLFYSEFMQSHLRPLRYAAVAASFSLCTSILTQMETTTADLKRKEKQLQKTGSGGGALTKTALARLNDDIVEVRRRLEVYESAVDDVWTKVFKRSWNDRDATIRSLAVKSYGAWCLKMPRLFLDDLKFRFLVWMMADPQTEVRQATGEVFCKLLAAENLRPTLRNYCAAIRNRILAFTRDNNEKVAVVGIQIATSLRNHFGRDYFEKDMIDEISLLLSSDSPNLRHAAGAFALPDIIANAEDYITYSSANNDEMEVEDEKGAKRKKGGKKSASTPSKTDAKKNKSGNSAESNASEVKSAAQAQILSLLDFIPEATDHHEFPGVVIEAIWKNEKDYFLFQFEEMAKLFSAQNSDQLSDDKVALLSEILLAVMRQLDEQTYAKSSKVFSISQLRKEFTEVFIVLLPSLLSSHKAEDKLLPSLTSLVKYLDLSHIGTLKSDGTRNHVSQMAQSLKTILSSTTNELVMTKAVSAFDHLLADTTFKYHRDVDRIMRSMVDEMTETLRQLVDKFDAPGSSQVARPKRRESNINSRDFVDGAAPGSAPLVLCLMRLFNLTRYFDLARLDDNIIDLALEVMEKRKDEMFTVVGPRSAHFACQISARLLCYRMNGFTTDAGLNASHVSETQDNYDLKDGEEDENDEEMMDTQATPSKRTRSRTNAPSSAKDDLDDDEDLNTPKGGAGRKGKKSKNSKRTEAKIYGSVVVPRTPNANEMAEVAKKVHVAVEYCQHLLDRTADDSDVSDTASYGAFISLCHLLSTFCPSIENTPLKPLAYHCSADLEEKLGAVVEAEMERTSSEESSEDLESRLLLVINFYYRLITIGVFGADGADKYARRCIAQLKSGHPFVAKSARQMLGELRASTYTTPALVAKLIVETLEYAYELTPAEPQTSTFDEANLQREVVALARQIAKSFPPANNKNAADTSKLVLDTLVRTAVKAPDDKYQLVSWTASPFVSKLSPAAARELKEAWNRYADPLVAETTTEMQEAYEELKTLVSARASGRRPAKSSSAASKYQAEDEDDEGSESESRTRLAPKRRAAAKARAAASSAARGGDDDSAEERDESDGEDDYKAKKTKTTKKTGAKATSTNRTKKSAAAIAAISASSKISSSMLRQGDGDSVSGTEDSDMMAHTDDEASEAEQPKRSKPSASRRPRSPVPSSSGQLAGESDSDDGLEANNEEEEVPHSQASVEIHLDQLLEPPSSRSKRGRQSVGSRTSVAVAAQGDDESEEKESEEQVSDSEEALMQHTPATKKKAGRK